MGNARGGVEKPPIAGKSLSTPFEEMHRWVENDVILSGSMRQRDVSYYSSNDSGKKASVDGDDIEDHIAHGPSGELIDYVGFDGNAQAM